jgi:hypothetical protein
VSKPVLRQHQVLNVDDGIHAIQAWDVWDDAERLAITLSASDVGRVLLQRDSRTFWIVRDDSEGGFDWYDLNEGGPAGPPGADGQPGPPGPAGGVIQAWTFYDNSERDSAPYDEATDIGRVAYVESTSSWFVFTGMSEGPQWRQLTPQTADEIWNPVPFYGSNAVGTQLEYLYTLKAPAMYTINQQAVNAYTLDDQVNGQLTTFTSSTAVAVTVPGTLTPGAVFPLVQLGTGQITVTGSGGLTVRAPSGLTLKSRAQYARLTVEILSPTVALLSGDLALA